MQSVGRPLITLIGGLLFVLVGLVLSTTINTQAASTGAAANIGSFSGARNLNDLIPLLWYMLIVVGVVGVVIGGLGFAGLGPAKNR